MTSTSSVSSTSTASTSTTPASDPASIGAALVTSLGLGTGIDMTTMATEIAQASYAGQTSALATQLSQVQVKISEAGQLKSDMLSLASSLGTLVDSGGLASTPTVSNSAVATASLPLGSSGANTSYNLEVDALASPQVLSSPAYSSANATTGSGTLTFNFGTITNGSFAADPSQSSVSVTIPSGATLSQVATAINESGAGISAYVATTANGAQLVMKGATGADSAFTVSATENSGDPGLSSLAWDPSTASSSTLAESASDAQFKLDGISQSSSSNTITNVAPGLSLSLTGTNVGNPTTVTYSNPSSNITSAMTNLTSALNSLVTELNTDTTPSANGDLSNDSGAQQMSRQLSELAGMTIMPNAAAGAPSTLADLGLVVNKDGSFTLNSTTLSNALATNPSAVAGMFTNGLYGVYGTIEGMSETLTSSTDPGSLAGSVTQYTALQTSITAQQSTVATEQSDMRTRLINQYATANASVAESKSTLTYLQNQIAAWNSSTGGAA